MATGASISSSSATVLGAYKDAVDSALESFFGTVYDRIRLPLSEQSQDALHKLQEYTLRPGKRIRGALASFAYDYATQAHFSTTGLQAAVALELAQSYMLIIDDVMDKSPLRRGLPSIHAEYGTGTDDHTANMMAVTVGLVASHLQSMVLADCSERAVNIQRALKLMNKNLLATGFGQLDDLYQHVHHDVSESDILLKYQLKSSYYTFVNPLQVGLALAGLDDGNIFKEVEDFGRLAGVAFQLHDDVLGIFGEEGQTGKHAADDIKEGKYTVLVQYALEHASDEDKQELLDALGNQQLSQSTFERCQQTLHDTGAMEYTAHLASEHANRAIEVITRSAFWDSPSQEVLSNLVHYSVSRKR